MTDALRADPVLDGLLLIAETALAADTFRPLDETLNHICDYVKAALNCSAVLLRIRSDRDQLVVGGHSDGIGAGLEELQGLGEETFSQALPGQRNPSVEVFSTGQPRYVMTTEFAPGTASRERLDGLGAVSMYFAPITREGSIIGVLNCYWPDEHEVTASEAAMVRTMARLAAVSLTTATIADDGEQMRRGLEAVHQQLQEDNSQLRNIHMAQSRMISLLADQSALTVEQTARLLASALKRSVMVCDAQGNELALEADRSHVDLLRAAAVDHAPARHRMTSIPGAPEYSVLRIDGGPAAHLGGLILVAPPIAVDQEFDLVVAKQAALVIGAHIQARSANTTMINHALPLAVLTMSRGMLNPSQLKELQALLALPANTGLGIAVLSTPTPEAAFRLSRRHGAFSSAGWSVISAVADGADVLVLLRGGLPARESAAAVIDRMQEVDHVGISSLVEGLDELSTALDQARLAAGIAEGGGSVAYYEDFGAFIDVTGGMSLPQIQDFVSRTIGPVEDYDRRRDADLMKTLKVYVEKNGQAPETAAVLSVHVNTLHKRLSRIEELSGLNLRSFRDLTRVMLALDMIPIASRR